MGVEMTESPVRFSRDKPGDCRFCYYWNNYKKCCRRGKENCYYILPEEVKPKPTRCDGCPYGQHAPCIGWCTVDVLVAVLGPKAFRQGEEVKNQCQFFE